MGDVECNEGISATRRAFMHVSLLDEIICYNSDIDVNHIAEIGNKCKQLGAACDVICGNNLYGG